MPLASTPGPLRVVRDTASDDYYVMTHRGRRVARVYGRDDARLFAAAPGLLEAVRELLTALDEAGLSGGQIDECRELVDDLTG